MKNPSTPFMHKPAMLTGRENAYQVAISDGFSGAWTHEELKNTKVKNGKVGKKP